MTRAQRITKNKSLFVSMALHWRIAASSKEEHYTFIPKITAADIRSDADYAYITLNNTIYGSRYAEIPDTGDVTLVTDASSGILSERLDVRRFGLIFAGAQKNIGPAGLTVVIIRKDLVGKAPENTPVYLDYRTHADSGSMYNTPPTWGIYIAGEVFKDLLAAGGIAAMERKNRAKAAKLYDYIDGSSLYRAPVAAADRSLMNVVFVTGRPDLDQKFVTEAKTHDLYELGGHRSVGGMRASIYNAMPEEGVDRLIEFMKLFEAENS
jgi:phosphoserine aminotransferase